MQFAMTADQNAELAQLLQAQQDETAAQAQAAFHANIHNYSVKVRRTMRMRVRRSYRGR
jgi:hypothetical protein